MKCGTIYVAFIAIMIEKFQEVVWTGPVAVTRETRNIYRIVEGKMDRLILKWVVEKEVMRIELAPDDVPGRSWCYLLLSEN
jgi:hypothetical protein